MIEIVITINEDGSVGFISNDNTKDFAQLGKATTKRASHVEPNNRYIRLVFHFLRKIFGDKGWMAKFTRIWPCLWRINLSPIHGPILEHKYKNRQQAIHAEIQWINENI